MEEEYINIQLFSKRFDNRFNMDVDVFRCRACGFKTEGYNLIEFHVFFQCKKMYNNV